MSVKFSDIDGREVSASFNNSYLKFQIVIFMNVYCGNLKLKVSVALNSRPLAVTLSAHESRFNCWTDPCFKHVLCL